MITEDYVSFEVAKLLKEKGFDNNLSQHWYNPNSKNPNYPSPVGFKDCLPAITLQMALKWLREVHNIYIDILTYTTGKDIQFRWVGYEKGRLFSQEEGKTIYFDSYEQAIEAAIKYCLENLI